MDKALSSDDLVDIGEEHHKTGRLQEAESCYRKALEIDPGHPGALYFLANIAYDDGRLPLATQLVEELLRDEPSDAEAWHLLGMIARKEESFPRAVECFKKAVALQPAYVQAHYSLANTLSQQGDIDAALASFQRVTALDPLWVEAHFASGNLLAAKNRLNEAVISYRQALEIDPTFVAAHFALGNIYQAQNKLDQAISSFQCAINEKPDLEQAYLNIGQILRSQERHDEALAEYRRAVVKIPNAAALHLNLGVALLERKHYADAINSLEKARLLDPDSAEAHGNLGIALFSVGKLRDAEQALKRLVELAPENSRSLMYLAHVCQSMGKVAEAIGYWRQAIELEPDYVDPYHQVLHFSQYLPGYSREQIFTDHLAFGERFEAPWRNKWIAHPQPVSSHKRLRVGFVSGDLFAHPVGFFLEGVLQELRRLDGVDIIVYSMNKEDDAVTERIRAATHEWLPVTALSDDDFEQRIRNDGVDILVDLSGHTANNRLLVFARKPAPIQVTWLGYWETTGLQAVDYLLCDRYSMSDDEANFLVERPWYLPHTRLCFTLPKENIAVVPLPAMSKGQVTFGCFNHLMKMTDRVVATWSRILKRIPDAHLMLKSGSLVESSIREEVIARFVAEGISADRLELEAASPLRDYFIAYNRVDIALDPFPFPGGTTSVQGIWMGVPMITLRGDRIISRQGESILQNLGLQDWIAMDEDDYVELAVKKAGDLESLSKLRSELREKLEKSPLADEKLFAKNLEAAFKQMWGKYCESSVESAH